MAEPSQSKLKKEDMVKLISAEGFEFVVHKKAAMVSQTIRNMLTSPGHPPIIIPSNFFFPGYLNLFIFTFYFFWFVFFFEIEYWVRLCDRIYIWFVLFKNLGSFAETEHGEVTFPEISTTILEKICQYFYWSLQYARFFTHLSLMSFPLFNSIRIRMSPSMIWIPNIHDMGFRITYPSV